MGYDARWGVLGAVDAGAPHKRDRIWIVGHLADAAKLFGDDGDDNAGIVVGRNSVPKSRNDCRAKDVADANCINRRERTERKDGKKASHASGDVADAANDGLGRREQQPQSVEGSRHVADTDVSQREGVRCANRSDLEHSDAHASSAWWRCDPAEASESGVGRMAHGVAARVDRLKAIGNGQVPSVAALAWRLLN
jgi:DNA (cytosine-5)-methyltransferase 1